MKKKCLLLLSLCLVGVLSACGSGSGSSSGGDGEAATASNKRAVPTIQTEILVSVDVPSSWLVQRSGMENFRGWLKSYFVPEALADPVVGAKLLIAYVGPDGLVLEIVTEEDGLVINDNGDGTYVVMMPGIPRVDKLLVADPNSSGAILEVGEQLPDGTIYSPAVRSPGGGPVPVGVPSSAAMQVIFSYTAR